VLATKLRPIASQGQDRRLRWGRRGREGNWAGKFSGTVAQRPDIMGRAVEIAAALMKGEKPADIPKHIDSGMILVTPENVDQYAQTLGVKKA
jgi:ABC-type sugar transport system substrate-binding protein